MVVCVVWVDGGEQFPADAAPAASLVAWVSSALAWPMAAFPALMAAAMAAFAAATAWFTALCDGAPTL
jgi:hypothetical protein